MDKPQSCSKTYKSAIDHTNNRTIPLAYAMDEKTARDAIESNYPDIEYTLDQHWEENPSQYWPD